MKESQCLLSSQAMFCNHEQRAPVWFHGHFQPPFHCSSSNSDSLQPPSCFPWLCKSDAPLSGCAGSEKRSRQSDCSHLHCAACGHSHCLMGNQPHRGAILVSLPPHTLSPLPRTCVLFSSSDWTNRASSLERWVEQAKSTTGSSGSLKPAEEMSWPIASLRSYHLLAR